MAALILWAPDIFRFFLQENLHAHKNPCFWGGGGYLFFFFLGGGVGKCHFCLWACIGDFSEDILAKKTQLVNNCQNAAVNDCENPPFIR